MRRRNVTVLAMLCLLLTSSAQARADRLEDFLRMSLNPTKFSAQNYHPDYLGETRAGGQTVRFDRDRLAEIIAGVDGRLSDFKLTKFRVLEREERAEGIWVTIHARYVAKIDGEAVEGEALSEGILVPGGPHGYQWLLGKTRESVTPHN